jgi:uncharacterized protein YggE
VRGAATAKASPDRAELGITLTDVKKTSQDALDAVGERSKAITRLLESAGVDAADWRTSGVRVEEEREWRANRSVHVGYRATASYALTIRDLTSVNGIVAGAVADAAADVNGPDWVASASNPARIAAYQQAALDAKVRAQAYADALGLTLGGVLSITEPSTEPAMPRPIVRAAMMATAAGPEPEPVHVGDIEIDAAVVVTFALAAPS